MLKEYQEYTKLTDDEIEMLVIGYRKRVECFEKIFDKIYCVKEKEMIQCI